MHSCILVGTFELHSRRIRAAFELHLSRIRGIQTAFEMHSGVLVGSFELHSSSIRAAFEQQSKDSDGIRSAFQLDSLSTQNIKIDSDSNRDAFEVHWGHSIFLVQTFQMYLSCIWAAILRFRPHSKCIPVGFLKYWKYQNRFRQPSRCILASWLGNSNCIRAAFERQSKIPTAFEVNY